MHLLSSWVEDPCPPVTFASPDVSCPPAAAAACKVGWHKQLVHPKCGHCIDTRMTANMRATHAATCRAGVRPPMAQSCGRQ